MEQKKTVRANEIYDRLKLEKNNLKQKSVPGAPA